MKKLINTALTILLFLIPKAYGQNAKIYYLKLSSQKLHDFSIPDSTRHLQALHLAHMAVSLDTNFADAYYTRGVCNRELGNLDKSMRDFNKVISLEPNNYYAYSCRADIKFRQNDILGSIEDYSFVLKNEPNHEVYYWRGKVFLSNKDFVNAITDFTQVINYNSAWVMESYYHRAEANFELQNFQLSLTDIDSALNLVIQTADSLEISKYYLLKGLNCSKLLNYYEAIHNFSKSIEFKSSYSDAFQNRGLAKKQLNDIAGSIQDFSIAIDLEPNDYKTYVFRGTSKINANNFTGALDDFNSALRINPNCNLCIESRADVNYKIMQYQNAISDYSAIIESNPQNAWAYFYRGNAYKKIGDLQKACSDWANAKSLNFSLAENAINVYCH